MTSKDVNTLAQVYTLKNNGKSVTDLMLSLEGMASDYVMINPAYSDCAVASGRTIEFTASPDLTKMKSNNVSKVEGKLVVTAGGSEKKFDIVFDTEGKEIITTTIGEIVEMQMNKYSTGNLSSQVINGGQFVIDNDDNQCTNAGKVTSSFYAPATGGKGLKTNADSNDVRLFVTSRMFGGGYVNSTTTNYDYYLNGVKVGVSKNSGLTDVSIAELPVDNLKFGATNTLVRDYDTNPGSHFVTASTEISIIYPADTPISYIGSPDTLPDLRTLPDFAVYSENIFAASSNIIEGVETDLSINIYNRGSVDGYCKVNVYDGEDLIYSNDNYFLEAFSGGSIAFKWTPENKQHEIKVELECVDGVQERADRTANNTAIKTFTARERAIPNIVSITPDYAIEGEGVVYANVANYDDIAAVEFYVDDVLYQGEIKSSIYSGMKRYWINDTEMSDGKHNIKVVVYYYVNQTETTSVEANAEIDVLDSEWNKYTFELDEEISNAKFYIYDIDNGYYSRTYDIVRYGSECTFTMSKTIYDDMENYIIFVIANNAIIYKNLVDDKTLSLDDCNTLTFAEDELLYIEEIDLVSVDDMYVYSWLYSDNSIELAPAKYNFRAYVYYMNEYKNIEFEVDMTQGDQTVDLSSYINTYSFEFADEIESSPYAVMYYNYDYSDEWYQLYLNTYFDGEKLICTNEQYDDYLIEGADNVIISVITDDIMFIADVKSDDENQSKNYIIDKKKLNKIDLSAGGSVSDFGILSVAVDTGKFVATLYSDTIYVTYGDYDISVYCKDIGDNEMFTAANGVQYFNSDSEKVYDKVTINYAKSFDRYSDIYLTNAAGVEIKVNDYLAGTAIDVNPGSYDVNVKLNRNSASYNVKKSITSCSMCANVCIDNKFDGEIVNTFDTYMAYSNLRIYLDNFVDSNGNRLTDYSFKDEEDKLCGSLIFTNVNDAEDSYSISVSLDNLSYFDIIIPALEGTYNVELKVSSESDLFVLRGLKLNKDSLKLNCDATYALEVLTNPEDIVCQKLVWTSSNESVATVDENGVVTTSKDNRGTTIITVSTEDGAISAQCEITVKFNVIQWLKWFFTFGCIREMIKLLSK
jgi:hypothetical protein